jgi:hypothetical protein
MTTTEPTPNPVPPPAYGQAQYGPVPPPMYGQAFPPAPVKKKRKWVLPVVMLTTGLIFGSAAGASQVPDPIVETKTETKTVTKEVEVTPDICITALEDAGEVNDLSARFAGAMNDIIKGVQAVDASQIRAANTKIEAINVELKVAAPKFVKSRESCQALAK